MQQRIAYHIRIHRDAQVVAANALARDSGHPFEQRQIGRGIATLRNEPRKCWRRLDRQKISNLRPVCRAQDIEPKRHAGAGVPKQLRCDGQRRDRQPGQRNRADG